jgi:AcrR family transcriptional regulator
MTHPRNKPEPAKRRRRDPRGTHDRLVRAALDLFTTQGYHASTTPEIAQRAGVAEGTIYRHFESKEHLLNEIYRAAVRLLTDSVTRSPGTLSCAARLEAIAAEWQTIATRDPGLVKLIFSTPLGGLLDAKSRDAFRALKDELTKVMAAGKASGEVRTGPVEVWTDVWLKLVVLTLERIAAQEWEPEQTASRLVVTSAWDAVRGA